jgi:hypothetical protein
METNRCEGLPAMTRRTLTRLYDGYDDAARAVTDLEAAGLPHQDISLISNSTLDRDRELEAPRTAEEPASDAGTGAAIGSALGGAAGLLAGLGLLTIPGIGPVVAAGWFAATAAGVVAGAAAGAAAGGIVGSLTEAGVPEHHAHVYAEGVRRGGTLVTARVDEDFVGQAEPILHRYRPVDPDTRATLYRESGWTAFDENAMPYDRAQIEQERTLYPRETAG